MANITKIAVYGSVGIVAVLALIFLLNQTNTTNTTYAVYQQPGYRLPIYLHTSKVLEDFNICKQYMCSYEGEAYFGEVEPAFVVGEDELTGNTICGCADGHTFQVRPDLIFEGTYE